MTNRASDPNVVYAELKRLSSTVPNLPMGRTVEPPSDPETLKWLGRLIALAEVQGNLIDVTQLRSSIRLLGGATNDSSVRAIMQALYNALAKAELEAPSAYAGNFIPVGAKLDAFASLAEVLSTATSEILIVDPYLDRFVVTDVIVTVTDGILVNLLTDAKSVKADFKPALTSYQAQYGSVRPSDARLTAAGQLHDRHIIIDRNTVWNLSQSIKDLAKRAPGSVEKSADDLSQAKLDFYGDLWKHSSPL